MTLFKFLQISFSVTEIVSLTSLKKQLCLISKKQFLVDSSCTMSIKHLYSYSWDTRAYTRGKEQPLKIDDHLPDCIRYALFSAKLRKTEYSGIEGIVTRPRTGISTILKNKRGTL